MGALSCTTSVSLDWCTADASGGFQWSAPGDEEFRFHVERLEEEPGHSYTGVSHQSVRTNVPSIGYGHRWPLWVDGEWRTALGGWCGA